MAADDVIKIGAAIMLSLGGAGVILFGLSSWLGKVWAERILTKEKAKIAEEFESFKTKLTNDTESHKIKLKKSEFIFAKEFDAASSLMAIFQEITSKHMLSSEMEFDETKMGFYEACGGIANNFAELEKTLYVYLKEHGAILPDDLINLISESHSICHQYKNEVYMREVSSIANKKAEVLYDNLRKANQNMIQIVRSQVVL